MSLGEKTPLCKSLDNVDIEHISDVRLQRVLFRVVFTTHTSRSLMVHRPLWKSRNAG